VRCDVAPDTVDAAICLCTLLQDMVAECQELLTLFGLPYIVAPAEAEAQCAWLEAAGLVDGVVTDDNDAFLFGAQHIYRHMFEDKK
jgi:DNA excision repair protein ERCC-5